MSPSEVEQARSYLARLGIETSPLPDGRFAVGRDAASTLEAARIVLLGLRHVQASRKTRVNG